MQQITLPGRIEEVECVMYMEHPHTKSIAAIAKDGRCFMWINSFGGRWLALDDELPQKWIDNCYDHCLIHGKFRIKFQRFNTYNFSSERGD